MEMELGGGGDSDPPRESTRSSPLGIDLNEIPSSAESFDVVRTYRDVPDLPPDPPAALVVPRGSSSCGACGRPESDGGGGRVVVCDGCERGFHLGCTGMQGAGDIGGEEWVCGECAEKGLKSRRWPLGFKPRRKPVIDMNASPPRDAEEAGEASIGLRKRAVGDISFGGNLFGSSVRYPNLCRAGSDFAFETASGILGRTFEAGFRDIRHRALMKCKGFEAGFGFPVENMKSYHSSAFRFPHNNPSDILMVALREYISQRDGILEEGWHVELKQSNGEICATYCAPDGARFDSMCGVASHLGLAPELKMSEPKAGSQGSPSQGKFHLPRKRKQSRFPATNGFTESKEFLLHAYYKEFLSDSQRMEPVACNNVTIKVSEAVSEDDIISASQQSNDGLPVQFEDFFLLSLGTIDSRPSYHGLNQIWPVGYRSCWHDKITRSLFFCDILDGGDSGPVFRIRRCSCSAESMPNGSTIFIRQHLQDSSFREDEESGSFNSNMELDGDVNIQSILSDALPPTAIEISTCLDRNSSKACNVPNDAIQAEATHGLVRSGTSPCDKLECEDEIGEIVVEERSSLLAWKKMSQKLVDSFSHLRDRECILRLLCKHVGNESFSANGYMMDGECQWSVGNLEKFQSLLISGYIISNESGHDIYSEVMADWWAQDRFGLDVDFVQEMVEQLPDVEVCSQYELLNKRSNYLKLLTFRNGSLHVRTNDGIEMKEEEALDSLFRSSKRTKIADLQRFPPAGTLLCGRLLPELAGDCYQIWEVLWRFHEILGLKETFSLEELEEELTGPGLSPANLAKNSEVCTLSNLCRTGQAGALTLSPSCASAPTAQGENLRAPVPTETATPVESNEDRGSSVRRGICPGVALTKVHSALLTVLVGELQSKVAAFVDPSLDGVELKPKRGRKRDIDSSPPVKRSKLNMLPINEMSWPELARRYILAILSMDGNSDSAEVIASESVKVYRCLQGDGGLLCGSLAGVAGMEADALLLAESSKHIFGSLSRGNDILTIEEEEPAESNCCETNASEPCLPDWAIALEPVKKLPTNVGTRIRKCIYDALEKHPPEWARKILEHSISKEVYKGNASGPTKKAVLSVLADASSERLPQKPEKAKKANTVITVSDILMKQCRIVLRQVAAADDSKVFCNLLGRKLVHCGDNDDEGLLGSPAMVSRPLDFRTIDLRLAVGAYGGSREAFLEDVQELWDNLRSAFGDQPDLVELADKLSEKFQTLCAEKVDPLVQQLGEYGDLESLSAEKKKELIDLFSSISVLPKAPWDEGVCKVCGLDKDDDSVLLCDTCDAEYHTYCLNPPLSRIPEGNWYCPSCVAGRRVTHDGSEQTLLRKRRGKRYQGEVTRDYLEALSHLASVMEEKEYWEYTIEERIFLLKFLCDELLNSGLIHQHLEHCADTTWELQQRLRSLSVESKALKSREEFLARAIKTDAVIVDRVAEALKEGLAPTQHANNGSLIVERQCESSNHLNITSERQTDNGLGKELSCTGTKKNHVSNGQSSSPVETDGGLEDTENAQVDLKQQGNLSSDPSSVDNAKSFDQNELPASDPETEDRKPLHEGINITFARNPNTMNEAQSLQVELNSVKNEISLLQGSMSSLQSQFLKLSIRREFLGTDSLGRMYWTAASPGKQLRFVADGSLAAKIKGKTTSVSGLCKGADLDGSKARCPYWYESNDAVAEYPQLVSYQSDAEIKELIGWLRDNDPKERAVKDAILHWQKFRSQDSQDCRDNALKEPSAALPFSNHLATRAALFLGSKYGPIVDSVTSDLLDKNENKGKVSGDGKIYRCKCLELILPVRFHCLSCHRTFLTAEDLEAHREGKCSSTSSDNENGKDTTGYSTGNGKRDMPEKSTSLELNSKLIKSQNEGSMCPYDIEEISSKFITKDSSRELVKQIGFIGSNGVPSFLPSRSPYLDDSTVMLIPKSNAGGLSRDLMDVEGSFNSSERRNNPNSRMFDTFNARSVGERSASKTSARAIARSHRDKVGASSRDVPSCRCVVPSSAFRPLVGDAYKILGRLKINILDMEAAVSEEAFKPSKARIERRWAWRTFVKSAQTIFQMVQASVIFEDMIKTQYLRTGWWYWSSLSAAIKTSTISSLALRIYSLDSSIIYDKNSPILDSADNCKPDSMLDQRPEPSDTAEKPKASRKSSRKRKELES